MSCAPAWPTRWAGWFSPTAAVYGDPVYTPLDEDHPLRPIFPYGASKLAAENLGFGYHGTFGLPFTVTESPTHTANANIAKAQRLLGFSPEVALKDGLGTLIRWLETRKNWQLSALRPR